MFAGKRVLGIEVMVEGLFVPVLLVMAGITLFTELSLVGIIGFVTIETQRRSLTVFFVILGMTKLACQAGMGPTKFEISFAVIERLTVKIDDIPLPALVFRMATLTVFCMFRIELAMKTLARFNILSHIAMVMAGEATLHLVRLLQSLVATFALLFELGMPCYHWAGH